MIWATEIRNAALLGFVFLGLLAVAEAWARLGTPKPESTRKLVHVGGGLACLAFPFLIHSPWVVLGMAVALSAMFALGARLDALHSLHRVERRTRGCEYYPLAIFLVFLIAGGQPWLFVSAVLVLAVADAFAALIGVRYGSLRYQVEDEYKSVEGSLAFLVIAFLAIYIPLWWLTDLPLVSAALAALLVAILVTGFEAISLSGTDNLFVPIGVAVILQKITTKPVAEIVYQNISLMALAVAVGALVWRVPSLNVGGAIAFFLFLYAAWSLGSELWALPVGLGFLAYISFWVWLPMSPGARPNVKVRTVFRAIVVPLLVLLIGNMNNMGEMMYGPFVAAAVTVLTMALWNHVMWARRPPSERRAIGALAIGLLSWAVAAFVPWLAQPGVPVMALVATAVVCLPAAVVNDRCMGPDPQFGEGRVWSASRLAITALAAAAVYLLQCLGVAPPWAGP